MAMTLMIMTDILYNCMIIADDNDGMDDNDYSNENGHLDKIITSYNDIGVDSNRDNNFNDDDIDDNDCGKVDDDDD
jgi:hypothetical protein